MGTLVVDLQAGFSGDTVSIRVNGSEVFHETDVSTDYSIGRAGSVEIQTVGGSVSVAVAVSTRNLASSAAHDVDGTLFLGIGVEGEEIVRRTSDEPFTYF